MSYTTQQLSNYKEINMIKEFYINGEEFDNLQLELLNFYNLDIDYSNEFDNQNMQIYKRF